MSLVFSSLVSSFDEDSDFTGSSSTSIRLRVAESLRAEMTAEKGWKRRMRLKEWIVVKGTELLVGPSTSLKRKASVRRLELEK